MPVVIPDQIIRQTNLSEEEFRIEVALLLFEKNILSFGQARRFSGMNVLDFQQLLAQHKIAMHYDLDDFQEDQKTIESLSGQ